MRETLKILPQKPETIVIDKSLNVSVQSVLFIIHPFNSIPHNLAKVLQKPEPIVIHQIAERLGVIGAIHHTPSQLNTS